MADSKLQKVKLIAGRSNPELADLMATKLGIPLVQTAIKDFGNTELGIEIRENIRGYHVYIIQTGGCHQGRSINDHLIELLNLIHACKLSNAKTINIIMPCYAYARSDKKLARESIMGSCLATILQSLGVNRIVAMDLHAGQIQGFFQGAFDNLYAINLHIDNLKKTIFKNMTPDEINNKYILVSPDVGAIKRIESYAKKLGMRYVVMHKHRDYDKPGTVLNSILIGDHDSVKGKTAIIIDDIFDSFGTLNAAVNELKTYDIKSVIAIATHGVFSGDAFNKINSNNLIEKVIVTNTLPQKDNLQKSVKLECVNISDLLAEVVKRLTVGGSVSELFS